MDKESAPSKESTTSPTTTAAPPPHIGMWDTFQLTLMFISLYVMATAIGLILNFYVDKWVPSATEITNYYAGTTFADTLFAGYQAALIVSFPFFAFFFLESKKRQLKYPEIVNLKSRKVLIYLTLIGTFIILMFNLCMTVYQLLSGNISLNFVLHFLVTISIAGSIFAYYLHEVRRNTINA